MIISGALLLLILGVIVYVGVGVAKWADARPIRHGEAKVVAKRSVQTSSEVSPTYYTTFELPSGKRIEFAVDDREFGLLVEGDRGTLSRRGRTYLGFDRERE